MAEPLPKETIGKARELDLCGKSKNSAPKELRIGKTTVYRYTIDIPSQKQQRIGKKAIQKIREGVLRGKSKYQIVKEMGLRFGVIYYHTKDSPSHVYGKKAFKEKS